MKRVAAVVYGVFSGAVIAFQLALALGIGKAQGLSRTRTILKTLAFGFTWWLPLKLGVIKK